MKRVLVLLNHPLSEEQKADLQKGYDVSSIATLDNEFKGLFSQVPADAGKEEINSIAKKFIELAEKEQAQILVVQGEPTLTFAVVKMASEKGLTCLAATTKRESKEITLPDGGVKKVNIFRHIRFREYA